MSPKEVQRDILLNTCQIVDQLLLAVETVSPEDRDRVIEGVRGTLLLLDIILSRDASQYKDKSYRPLYAKMWTLTLEQRTQLRSYVKGALKELC